MPVASRTPFLLLLRQVWEDLCEYCFSFGSAILHSVSESDQEFGKFLESFPLLVARTLHSRAHRFSVVLECRIYARCNCDSELAALPAAVFEGNIDIVKVGILGRAECLDRGTRVQSETHPFEKRFDLTNRVRSGVCDEIEPLS